MNPHRHLSSEEIFEQLSAGDPVAGASGCASCEAEASSLSRFLIELKQADTKLVTTTDWDDLLIRRRIREALAQERPHVRSIFDRFTILKPAFVSAMAAVIALAVWSPLARYADKGTQVASLGSGPHARIPAWIPLPEESEDEGLALLAEWTPNADEVAIAACHFSCLSGLSDHEEENLLHAETSAPSRSPITQSSPL